MCILSDKSTIAFVLFNKYVNNNFGIRWHRDKFSICCRSNFVRRSSRFIISFQAAERNNSAITEIKSEAFIVRSCGEACGICKVHNSKIKRENDVLIIAGGPTCHLMATNGRKS